MQRRTSGAAWYVTCAAILSALLLVPLRLLAAEAILVTTLPRDGQLLISFELPGAYTDELRDAIASGLATTFTYAVELRDPTPFWFDRTIDRVTVAATVRFDSLTRQYAVSRGVSGQPEDRQIVADEEAVRQLLTRFDRLPLFNTAVLAANGEYHVRVRARTRPRITWFFWPWDSAAASGAARFTFLP